MSRKKVRRKQWFFGLIALVFLIGGLIGWQLGYFERLVSAAPDNVTAKNNAEEKPVIPSPNQVSDQDQIDKLEPEMSTDTETTTEVKKAEKKPANEPSGLALDRTKRGWGYRVRINQPPEVSTSTEQLLARYGALYRVNTQTKKIALTFDLGYENGHTAKIVDILATHKVPATFFATGEWLKDPQNVKLAQKMVQKGHTLGNHSYSHPSFPTLTKDKLQLELSKVEDQLAAAGLGHTHYFRPPMGEYSEESLKRVQEAGYTTVFWSVALRDWIALPGGSEEYYQTVMKRVHPGAILLLHAVSPDLLPVLDTLITDLRAQGYQLVSLDELCR